MTHGELVRGSQSLSGEIGHMTLNPVDGPPASGEPRVFRGYGLGETPAGDDRGCPCPRRSVSSFLEWHTERA